MKDIRYSVERTKNRHSRALLRDGAVIIRLARRLTPQEEREHVTDLLRRMAKALVKESKRVSIDPFRTLLEGADRVSLQIPILNRTLQFNLQPAKRSKVKYEGDVITVSVPERVNQRELSHWLWRILASFTQTEIESKVQHINRESFNARIDRIVVRHMKSQWGSCSSQGTITLNTALLLVPEQIFTYVVIHELAHRLHRNHSAKFWNAIEQVLPEYEKATQMLRKFKLT